MKKVLVFIFIQLCVLLSVTAQPEIDSVTVSRRHFTFSGRAGIGQSSFQTRNFSLYNVSPRLSLSAGALADYWLTDNVSLESGFILITKGATISSSQSNRDNITSQPSQYELLYGEIPLTPKYTWTYQQFKLYTYLGPSANILFSSRLTRPDATPDSHDGPRVQDASRVDCSLLYGFGISSARTHKGNFFADVRFSQDLTSFSTLENEKLYNYYYSISAGYTFR